MNDDVKPFAHNNQKSGGEGTANHAPSPPPPGKQELMRNEEYNIKMFLRNTTFQPQ